MTIPKETWGIDKVEVRNSIIHGLGLFAKEQIAKFEEIIIWKGQFLSDSSRAVQERASGKMVIQWDENLYTVEDKSKDDAYFINHSCDSNLWIKGNFILEARRDIQKGEEITLDYALIETKQSYISKWTCRCGNERCRKVITGLDWKDIELQNRYEDHFVHQLPMKRFSAEPKF